MNIQQTTPPPKLVTMIPADPQMAERDLRKKHLRVAPYCRVSTDKEEQLSSYEAQIEYYTEKIDANPDWTMVRLYADEGITGTSAKKRKDFLQMIRDCERGKIDLVITKSVSRFCRNTLDGLNYVRRLKRHGVGVYFEKENVNTLFMDNEMILTFMMSQAQAESESLSGNVKWGHRKNFKDGKVYYHCKNFLGYRWGADGQPEIDPEQAAVVRRIFSRFLLGHSVRQITTDLMTDGIKTATGKTVWHDSVIQKMLCNEKYIGDALLQKTYIADRSPEKSGSTTENCPNTMSMTAIRPSLTGEPSKRCRRSWPAGPVSRKHPPKPRRSWGNTAESMYSASCWSAGNAEALTAG